MTITLLYALPRTFQKQTQQEAETLGVQLEQDGNLEALRLQETGRTAQTIAGEVQFSVEYTTLGAAPPLPSFLELYPTTEQQQMAVDNLWTARLQAALKNTCRQVSITIAP